jgi:hypothetical protein
MKKFNEILQEIEQAKHEHSTKAGDALSAFYKEFDTLGRFTARKNGDADFLSREKKLLNKASAEERKNEESKIKIAILTQNAKRAFFAENIGKICEIWNRYAGKKYGEKTADKIRDELRTATGAGVWISRNYNETKITIYLQRANGCAVLPNNETEINAYIKDYTPTDDENKIKPLDAGAVVLYWCGAYVDDIGEHLRKFYEAREALRVAEENAKQAREAYNELTRGNMTRADRAQGFPTWIF